MKKRLFASILGMAILGCQHVVAQPLLKDGKLEISQEAFIATLQSGMPDDYFNELLESPERLERQLRDMHLVKVMAARAAEEKLDQQPLTIAQVEYMRDKFLAQQYLNSHLSQIEAVDYETVAKEAYALNKDKYVTKESVHAEHILISTKERDEAAAKELADEVHAKAKSKDYAGKFAELAVEYSEDPSAASNKGDLGFFERGRMVPQFEQAAFALKKGEITAPVKTAFGYHIIRLIDHKPERQLSFDDVKERLLADAEKTYKQKKQTELVNSIMSAPDIQVDVEALKGLAKQAE